MLSTMSGVRSIDYSLTLKPVLGEGREERWKMVQKIFTEHLEPLYGSQTDTLKKIENQDYRCRLLLSDKEPVGLLVHTRCESSEEDKNCLEIKTFYAADHQDEIEGRPYSSYLLEEAIGEAKERRVDAITIEVSKQAKGILSFLEQKDFRILQQRAHSDRVLLELALRESRANKKIPANASVETREPEPPLPQKPARKPFVIPIPGRENREPDFLKRKREESNGTNMPNPGGDVKRRRGSYNGPVIQSRFPQTRKPSVSTIPLKRMYLDLIKNGSKTIEGRINTGVFSNLREGQEIQFFCGNDYVDCTITKIEKYPSFPAMLDNVGFKPCLPNVYSREDAIRAYHSIPQYEEKARRSGVLAIHIKLNRR